MIGDHNLFFLVISLLPILSSGILTITYFHCLPESKSKIKLWVPVILGFTIPLPFLLLNARLDILGILLWFVLGISYWYGWKMAASKVSKIRKLQTGIKEIGISEEATTSADPRGAPVYKLGSTGRTGAFLGLLVLLPLIVTILNSYLSLNPWKQANKKLPNHSSRMN